MSLIKEARSSSHVDVLAEVARIEGVDYEALRRRVADGRVIVPRNVRKKRAKLIAIGEGLTTKVNVNVGTSGVFADPDLEVEKTRIAVRYGTDTIMDLSTGGDLDEIRRRLIDTSDGTPLGQCPLIKHGSMVLGSMVMLRVYLVIGSLRLLNPS
jgi:phosphomethylpyrimidine synthase